MRKSAGRFFARWVIATFAGWVVGIVLVLVLAGLSERLGVGDQFPVGIGMGLGVGFVQWLVARRWFGATSVWVWASTTGMGVPFVLSDLVGVRWDTPLARTIWLLCLAAALGGFLVGVWQRRTLATRSVGANWWVAASTAGWALAAVVGPVLMYPGHPPNAVQAFRNIGAVALGGIVLGVATGGALVWMIRPSESAVQDR